MLDLLASLEGLLNCLVESAQLPFNARFFNSEQNSESCAMNSFLAVFSKRFLAENVWFNAKPDLVARILGSSIGIIFVDGLGI